MPSEIFPAREVLPRPATSSTACGACVSIPSGSCALEDVGLPCPDGGICNVVGFAGGGGSISGTQTSPSYALGICIAPGDAGDGLDASALTFPGEGGAMTSEASSEPSATDSSGTSSAHAATGSSGTNGGCGVAATLNASPWPILASVGSCFMLFHRRRSHGRRRQRGSNISSTNGTPLTGWVDLRSGGAGRGGALSRNASCRYPELAGCP